VAVSASANPGYVFVNWTENGNVVGASALLELTSDTGHTLVANFLMQPALRLTDAVPGILTLSWPADATGWLLQESLDLSPDSWTNSARVVDVVNARSQVTVSPETQRGFFRLQHP
jgi:hypothetical protein